MKKNKVDYAIIDYEKKNPYRRRRLSGYPFWNDRKQQPFKHLRWTINIAAGNWLFTKPVSQEIAR